VHLYPAVDSGEFRSSSVTFKDPMWRIVGEGRDYLDASGSGVPARPL